MMGQSTTLIARPAEPPGRISSPEPQPVPYSPYPSDRDCRARVSLGQGQQRHVLRAPSRIGNLEKWWLSPLFAGWEGERNDASSKPRTKKGQIHDVN